MLVLKAPGVILMVVARRKMSHIGGSLRAAAVALWGGKSCMVIFWPRRVPWGVSGCPHCMPVVLAAQWRGNASHRIAAGAKGSLGGRSGSSSTTAGSNSLGRIFNGSANRRCSRGLSITGVLLKYHPNDVKQLSVVLRTSNCRSGAAFSSCCKSSQPPKAAIA